MARILEIALIRLKSSRCSNFQISSSQNASLGFRKKSVDIIDFYTLNNIPDWMEIDWKAFKTEQQKKATIFQ